MPRSKQFQRKRLRAQRQAVGAVRRARSELPEYLRSQVSKKVSTVTDQGLAQGTKVPAGFASVAPSELPSPVIRFSTTLKGTLVAPQKSLLGIARHEVAHLLPGGAKHPAIAAAGGGSPQRGGDLASGVQVQHAGKFQQRSRERRRALLRRGRKTNK